MRVEIGKAWNREILQLNQRDVKRMKTSLPAARDKLAQNTRDAQCKVQKGLHYARFTVQASSHKTAMHKIVSASITLKQSFQPRFDHYRPIPNRHSFSTGGTDIAALIFLISSWRDWLSLSFTPTPTFTIMIQFSRDKKSFYVSLPRNKPTESQSLPKRHCTSSSVTCRASLLIKCDTS